MTRKDTNYIYLRIFYLVFCGIPQLMCEALDDQRGAFVQTGEELHFFVDAQQYWSESVSARLLADGRSPFADQRSAKESGRDSDGVERRSSPAGGANQKISNQSVKDDSDVDSSALNQLKFEPPSLEFGYQAIGVPEQKKVKVTNPTASKVRFDAISGSTVHFHCSFFEDKTIEPGSTTTFDVVFLPRQEGELKNTLSIHSSLGAFHYIVSGSGTSNPYRLRPFVGARVPLNGSFIGPLELHNPHPTTLRVVEMYTSGGDLHVELPVQGRGDGVPARSVWEIPPFQTRTVGKARYIGARVKNATAYIRIKTDRDGPDDARSVGGGGERKQEALIVPLEIEVTAKPGLYAAVDRLDFGTIVEGEQSKWVVLEIYNTHNRTVEISSIEADTKALRMDFRPVVTLKSQSRSPTYVAKFAYDGIKSELSGRPLRHGRITIKSIDGLYALSVPYSVQVLEGRLIHDPNEVAFYNGQQQKPFERNITLWNVFDTPVAIYNVSLPKNVRKLFKIQNFISPTVIPPRSMRSIITLTFNPTTVTPSMFPPSAQLESRFRLHTNVSRFDIPLQLFDGNLRFTLYSIDQREFDFGILDVGQERFILFAVTNENPIAVSIKNMTNAMPAHTSLELLGVEDGNHSVLSYDHSPSDYKWKPGEDFTVPARSFAVFRYTVVAPYQRAVYHGRMMFRTAFQLMEFPVTFAVEEGSIVSVPERIVIDDAFPGKISSHALQVFSTFSRDTPLLRLSTLSNDPRFFFESLEKEQSPIIKAGEITRLGRIFFMPLATCLDDCYVGLPLDTEDGRHWTRGMRLPPDLPETDIYLYRKLRSKWDAIVDRGEHIANSTIMVDSTEVKGFAVSAEGRLVWPRLMKQSAVHFPLTAVGNYTIVNVTLQNPSNFPVAVQLLPLTIYPGPYELIKMLENNLDSPLTSFVEVDDVLIFSLRDSELYNARPESPVPHLRQELERIVGIQIPRFTLSMLLQPGMKVRVRIGFLPPDYQLRSTLLLIRNNLTVLETVTLYGRGGKLELRIGTKLPNSKQPLLFEIQDKHLKECENLKRLQHKLATSLTVRRSFVARNTGELPLLISNMSVSGHPCHGRGFRILNCEPFRLQPNETHVLEIAFTPDFTMSWSEAYLQLYIAGTLTPLNYGIGVSLPREWLSKCQAALPRPYWEPLMYYSCVTALGFLLICVIASAYLEGDRIITCALQQHIATYRRRVTELNGSLRPFSLRQPQQDFDFTSYVIPDADVSNGAAANNNASADFDGDDSNNVSRETMRSLPYRLVLLFYYLITKKLWSIRRARARSQEAAYSDRRIPASRPRATDRSAATTTARVHESTSSRHHQSEPKARRSSNSQSGNAAESTKHATNRKSQEDTGHQLKRPSPSQTPPMQQQTNDRKVLVSKGPKRRHGYFMGASSETSQSQKQGKENTIVLVTEELIPINISATTTKSRSAFSSPPHSPAQTDQSATSNIRRRTPLVEKENRKSDNDHQQPKEADVLATRSRRRSSRDVSEGEHDDRSASGHSQQILANRSRPILSRHLEEDRQNHGPAASTKPDNRDTAAALKVQKAVGAGRKLDSEESAKFLKPPVPHGARSESEESALPEWDRASLPSGGEHTNADDAFDMLASQTQSFATGTNVLPVKEPQQKIADTRNKVVIMKRQRLTVNTSDSSMHSLEKSHSPATNLPSPTGESVISSTSRSGSLSSLDASESSSPSPDEIRNKKKPGVASADLGQRKKKIPPMAVSSSPRQHSRVQKPIPAHMPSVQKKPQQVLPVGVWGAAQRQPAPQMATAGAIGEGRRHLAPQPSHPAGPGSGQQKSIMQQLRDERKRRLQEYKQKAQSGEVWPGFDSMPLTLGESLWDEDRDPWRRGTLTAKGASFDAVSDESRPTSDIWAAPTWSHLPRTERSSGTDSPFPSFFDFRVSNQNPDWSNAFSPSGSPGFGAGSPLTISNEQGQKQKQSPPPPHDSSIVAWGPSVSGAPPGLEQAPSRSPFGAVAAAEFADYYNHTIMASTDDQCNLAPPATWPTGTVMTGFDIPLAQTLLKDDKNASNAPAGRTFKK